MLKFSTIWLSSTNKAIFMRINNICRTFKKWTRWGREVINNSMETLPHPIQVKMTLFICLSLTWKTIKMKICIHQRMDLVESMQLWTNILLRSLKWVFQKKKRKAMSAIQKWVMTKKTLLLMNQHWERIARKNCIIKLCTEGSQIILKSLVALKIQTSKQIC